MKFQQYLLKRPNIQFVVFSSLIKCYISEMKFFLIALLANSDFWCAFLGKQVMTSPPRTTQLSI